MLTQANSKLADIIAEQEAIFVKRQPASAALASRAAGVLAGGVTSNWQITQPQAVWLSHGAGGKVYDADGNEYVDLHGGYGAALAGQARQHLAGGVTSSWQITAPQPVWLSHGRGSKVYDVDGNERSEEHTSELQSL